MQRRKAIATAGAVTATAAAAVIAFGANFGIFGLSQDNSNVGKFPAVDATSSAPAPTSPTTAPDGRDGHQGRERGGDQRADREGDD